MNTAVETFVQQHDGVTLMKNDLRVRDVLAYFIICRADPSLIRSTFIHKLLLGVDSDASERSVKSRPRNLVVTFDFCSSWVFD